MNDNLSPIITPTNLVKDNLSRVMSLGSKGVVMLDHFIRARWKIMKFDFLIFNVSLLAASQTVNFASSVLRIPITSSILLPSMKSLVSSANRIENNLSDTLGRSLMQIKKNSGPKTDPCGTPQVTVFEVDLELFIVTNCYLFVRYRSAQMTMNLSSLRFIHVNTDIFFNLEANIHIGLKLYRNLRIPKPHQAILNRTHFRRLLFF